MAAIIYQYLPLNTFHTSIRNKTIRLCDISKSNDYLEKKVYRECLKNAIDRAFQMLQLRLTADTETATGYTFSECVEDKFNEHLSYVTFASCFSRNGDLLSQWRGYANDAEGMAIGYDRTVLERCLRDDHRFRITDIEYKYNSQVELLAGVFFDYIWAIERGYNIKSREDLASYLIDEFEEVLEDMTEAIAPAVCSMKNPAFAEETETRIVFDPDFGDVFELNGVKQDYTKIRRCARLQMSPIDYFVRNGILVPFIDINYEKAIDSGIIKKITIGPKAKVSPEELGRYLYFNGFSFDAIEKIEIDTSTLSYR